jgi:beta-alanine--pyruvate transaminase
MLANKIKELTPAGLDYVFFTGSGSEAADTSLKMARAYWRAKGQASKTRFVGREKGYHGVNFGGISVGGILGNRKVFGHTVEADHIPHTLLAKNGSRAAASARRRAPTTVAADPVARRVEHRPDRRAVRGWRRDHSAGRLSATSARDLHEVRHLAHPRRGHHRLRARRRVYRQRRSGSPISQRREADHERQPLGAVVAKKEIYDAIMAAGGPEYCRVPARLHVLAHPVAQAGVAALDLLVQENAIARVGSRAVLRERALAQRAQRPTCATTGPPLSQCRSMEERAGEASVRTR